MQHQNVMRNQRHNESEAFLAMPNSGASCSLAQALVLIQHAHSACCMPQYRTTPTTTASNTAAPTQDYCLLWTTASLLCTQRSLLLQKHDGLIANYEKSLFLLPFLSIHQINVSLEYVVLECLIWKTAVWVLLKVTKWILAGEQNKASNFWTGPDHISVILYYIFMGSHVSALMNIKSPSLSILKILKTFCTL